MSPELFKKCVVNRYKAVDERRNDYKLYRRSDFTNWAKEAFENGEEYFYCRPVDPNDPYGEYELCEPEYRWFLKDRNGLSEDQYAKEIAKEPKKNAFVSGNYGWSEEAEKFGNELSNAVKHIIAEGLKEFTPEAVHYIADTIINDRIFDRISVIRF